jgi:ribosome-associated protein
MTKQIFTLNEDSEFIPLDKFLKFMQLVNSGGEAHMVILDGLVKVNGVVELQKRKKLRVGDKVEFNGEYIVVEK